MISRARRPFIGSFLIACLVALILLLAAGLKWVYPSAQDPIFYKMVGGLEALLAVLLLIYYRSWRVWVVLVLIVSLWLGFSFYVTFFGLPCSCMGGGFILPRGVSLILNVLMFLAARWVINHQPAHPVRFKRLIWFCVLFAIIGFSFSAFYFN